MTDELDAELAIPMSKLARSLVSGPGAAKYASML